jgi:hypothetical protein
MAVIIHRQRREEILTGEDPSMGAHVGGRSNMLWLFRWGGFIRESAAQFSDTAVEKFER